MRDGPWRTHMARLAATEHGADWVINTDADEFWMPTRRNAQGRLRGRARAQGVVYALSRHFVPRPDDGAFFAERMTVRVSPSAAINDPTSPYRPHLKAAHRPDPRDHRELRLAHGRERVGGARSTTGILRTSSTSRSGRSSSGRTRVYGAARGDKPLGQYVTALRASEGGRSADRFHALVVDDTTLERGGAAGSLVATIGCATRSALCGVSVKRATWRRSTKGACPRAQRFATPISCGSSASSTVSPEGVCPRRRGTTCGTLGSASDEARVDHGSGWGRRASRRASRVPPECRRRPGHRRRSQAEAMRWARCSKPYVRRATFARASGSLTELGRLAVAEYGADWVFAMAPDEFWWPRGESLKDVLAVIPPRYAVVQALVREFGGSTGRERVLRGGQDVAVLAAGGGAICR